MPLTLRPRKFPLPSLLSSGTSSCTDPGGPQRGTPLSSLSTRWVAEKGPQSREDADFIPIPEHPAACSPGVWGGLGRGRGLCWPHGQGRFRWICCPSLELLQVRARDKAPLPISFHCPPAVLPLQDDLQDVPRRHVQLFGILAGNQGRHWRGQLQPRNSTPACISGSSSKVCLEGELLPLLGQLQRPSTWDATCTLTTSHAPRILTKGPPYQGPPLLPVRAPCAPGPASTPGHRARVPHPLGKSSPQALSRA